MRLGRERMSRPTRELLVTFLAIQLVSLSTEGASCNQSISIESDTSIRLELDNITTPYNISIIPRHDISTSGFVFSTKETSVQISYLNSDTLYDVKVESANLDCNAHTYPAPIQVIVGQEPTPHSVLFFVGPNPRVTQWEMELNFINGTAVRKWNTSANTFFGFSVTDLLPNTDYKVHARVSQILGEPVEKTAFGNWTTFTTGMLSVFGRVTLTDVPYENSSFPDAQSDITSKLRAASMKKGNFSDLSIIQITNTSGLATVDYEIEIFQNSFADSPNFTLPPEEFSGSITNNGGNATGTLIWSIAGQHELFYHTTLNPECRTIVKNTDENGVCNVLFDFLDTESSCGLRTFTLNQEIIDANTDKVANWMDNNTINALSVTVLTNDRANRLPFTRIYEAQNGSSNATLEYYFFNKDIRRSTVPTSQFKYTLRNDYDSAMLFLPNVEKSVKYEIEGITGILSTLSQTGIDGSEYLQIPLHNLTANETYEVTVVVTARNRDGGEASTEVNFAISTNKFLPSIPVQVDSTNSSIHVRWDKTYSGIAFSIVLSGENSASLQEVNTTESSYNATNLTSGNTMEFCMQILYCAIPPGNSTCRSVHTVPSHLENVSFFSTFDSITASWSPVKGSQKYVSSLAVMTNKRIRSGNNFPLYKETTGTNLTFDSLEPATEYIFSIAAANDAGNGTYVEKRVSTAIPEMTSTVLQWWWILGGFALLLSLVIGLIIAHVRVNHWYAKLDVTTRNELNSSRCFSCWSAILMVQESKMNDREMNDDVEDNGVKSPWFPWRRVFNVSAQQRRNKADDQRDENPYDMAHENQQRGCCGWKAIFWIPRDSQQDTRSTEL